LTTRHSNSGIATFQRCPLAYQYEQVLKLRRIDEDSSAHHLIFGAAIHKALEVLYTKGDLKLSKETMREYYPVQLDTEDFAKTADNACYALEKYWEHYDQDKDWEVVAVEGREFTDSGFGIKPDLVVRDHNDSIFLCDHKTTGSYLAYDYFSQFDPNAQITHYINWCRGKYGHCDGFIVNAIRFAFLKRASKDRAAGFNVEFERQVFQRTKTQIERTLRATEETIKDIERCRETGFWRPQEQPNSCKFCSYRSICSAGWSWEEDSELILNNWRQICDQPISETEEHCQLDLGHSGNHSPLYTGEPQEEFQVEV
jgi:hypothetical protein